MHPSKLEIQKLVIYSELLTKMTGDLDHLGRLITECCQNGGMDVKEMREVHKDMILQIEIFEPRRIEIVKELTRRLKNDIGINRGPGDIDAYCNKILAKYIHIGKTKEQIAAYKDAEKEMKTKPADMKVIKSEPVCKDEMKIDKGVLIEKPIWKSKQSKRKVTEAYALKNPDLVYQYKK